MTNGNASSFDNFAITKLPDDATEGIDIDSDEVSIVIEEKQRTAATAESKGVGVVSIMIAVLVTVAAAGLLAASGLILFKLKKCERK